MARIHRDIGTVAVVVAGSVAVFAGILLVTSRPSGEAIADRIRAAHSPIVQTIDVSPRNPLYGVSDQIYIEILPDATDAAILDLWCHVVVPAGASKLPAHAVTMSWSGQPQAGRHMPIPVCPADGSSPTSAPDLGGFEVVAVPGHPSTTGSTGSAVFEVGTIENPSRARTARVTLRMAGESGAPTVTLPVPVVWLRPAEVATIDAAWVAPADAPYPDVHVEITEVTFFAAPDRAWYDHGVAPGDVTCTTGTPDAPSRCTVLNRTGVPLRFVEVVTIRPRGATFGESPGRTWVGPGVTTVGPGQTYALDASGLAGWWAAAVAAASAGFDATAGAALAADQPGLGSPLP